LVPEFTGSSLHGARFCTRLCTAPSCYWGFTPLLGLKPGHACHQCWSRLSGLHLLPSPLLNVVETRKGNELNEYFNGAAGAEMQGKDFVELGAIRDELFPSVALIGPDTYGALPSLAARRTVSISGSHWPGHVRCSSGHVRCSSLSSSQHFVTFIVAATPPTHPQATNRYKHIDLNTHSALVHR
jgi:hypothetical protein